MSVLALVILVLIILVIIAIITKSNEAVQRGNSGAVLGIIGTGAEVIIFLLVFLSLFCFCFVFYSFWNCFFIIFVLANVLVI